MIMTRVLIIHDVLFSKTVVALKGPVVTEMIELLPPGSFSRRPYLGGGGLRETPPKMLSLVYLSDKYSRLAFYVCTIVMPGFQCFDAVGWAAARAFGL